MTETIRNWILSLGGAAVLGALALAITPEGLCGVLCGCSAASSWPWRSSRLSCGWTWALFPEYGGIPGGGGGPHRVSGGYA
jgi:hypothetical protein